MFSCRRVDTAEDYVDLLAAIEDTAAHLEHAGCASRATRRLPIRGCDQIKVTPDPGVIEVNVHPAHNWSELVDQHDHAL